MNKKNLAFNIRLFLSVLLLVLYLPHLCAFYSLRGGKTLIISDIDILIEKNIPHLLKLLYCLHNNVYYRNLFYHRIGKVRSYLISWIRPGCPNFIIGSDTIIGEAMWIAHPFATILNADYIGSNFRCIHCTTLGKTEKGRPRIGNNVSLGANVTIIGNVTIGNNVKIGAGSVVVKDIPDNCIAVGNPCNPVKFV